MQEAAGSLLRLGDLMHHPVDPLLKNRFERLPAEPATVLESEKTANGGLCLENMSFGYGSLPDLFSNVSCRFEPGVITGVVGPSGVGKSTFARICAGMLAQRDGRVLFEGRELSEWRHEILRQKLLYVPQTGAVFTASVRDNLSMWDKTIDDDQLHDALEKVGLTKVVQYTGGLDRLISSQQLGFSGGELQRLALARALVRAPRLLILDEVTSALDALSEKRILGALRESRASVLIVTHRIGTTNRCDQRLHLDGNGGFALKDGTDAIRSFRPQTPVTKRDVA